MAVLEEVELEQDIDRALETLPDDPEKCYSEAVDRMRKKTKFREQHAFRMLAWLSYASKPLSQIELLHALAFMSSIDKFPIPEGALVSPAELSAYCCGLVIADDDKPVRFVHYSAKSFFVAQRAKLFENFHFVAAFTCIKYISKISLENYATPEHNSPDTSNTIDEKHLDDNFSEGESSDNSSSDSDSSDSINPFRRRITVTSRASRNRKRERLLRDHPFASYAGNYFHVHYRKIEPGPVDMKSFGSPNEKSMVQKKISTKTETASHKELIDILQPFLENDDRRAFYLDILEDSESYYEPNLSLEAEEYYTYGDLASPPLSVATFLGCFGLVQRFLRSGADVDELDSYEQTALIIAFKNNFHDIIDLLLTRGAKVDLANKRGHMILRSAAQMGLDQVVRAIVVSAPGMKAMDQSRTILSLFLMPVLILLFLAELTTGSSYLAQLLRKLADFARSHGQVQGEDGKQKAFHQRSCRLLLAACEGNLEDLKFYLFATQEDNEMIQHQQTDLRLNNPEPIDTSDTEGSEYSDFTSSEETEENPQSREMFLSTACFLAVEYNALDLVRTLLDNGVDIDVRDHQGQTLLHRATAKNHIQLVKFLLDSKANVSSVDHWGRTALTANANADHAEGNSGPNRVCFLE